MLWCTVYIHTVFLLTHRDTVTVVDLVTHNVHAKFLETLKMVNISISYVHE